MESSQRLNSSYVAIEFNGGEKKLLNTLESVEVSYPGSDYTAVEGRYLTSGELGSNESKSYSIKLWMDESVIVSDDAMNKSFVSKVVVTAKQSHVVRLADMVELGDYVEMTPTSTSYTIPSSMTGYSSDQTINPSELNLWRVIKKNDDGTMEVVSEYVSSTTIYLSGIPGYNNLVATLQSIASQYENSNFTFEARHIGYNGQTYQVSNASMSTCGAEYNPGVNYNANLEPKGCGDNGQGTIDDLSLLNNILGTSVGKSIKTNASTSYWNCHRLFVSSGGAYVYYSSYINSSGLIQTGSWIDENYFYGSGSSGVSKTQNHSIRPVLTIGSSVLYEKGMGDGSLENPFTLKDNE